MQVALLQTHPELGAVERNLAHIRTQLSRQPADLWILPELATTGYLFADRDELARLAEPIPGPSTEALVRRCAELGTTLVVGIAERFGRALYNSAAYLGPDGVRGVYRKVHLFEREKLAFDPGPDPFRVFGGGGLRLGIMICFDWMFPEAARSLALLGADLIAHPANLVLPHCQDAMVTRALENGVFVATANRVGLEERAGRSLRFTGHSQVVGPRGEIIVRGGESGDEVLVATIDVSRAREKRITDHNDRLRDRRPECYSLGDAVRPS